MKSRKDLETKDLGRLALSKRIREKIEQDLIKRGG